jgi:hypothetical protein
MRSPMLDQDDTNRVPIKTIVHCHGNTETLRSQYVIWENMLATLCCQVLVIEYPDAFRCAIDHHRNDIDFSQLYLSGYSIGTGVVMQLYNSYFTTPSASQ